MTAGGTIAVDTVNDRVELQVAVLGRVVRVELTVAQARDLADAMREAADFAGAAGRPAGHA